MIKSWRELEQKSLRIGKSSGRELCRRLDKEKKAAREREKERS
jgi:hypothetical protein